jgi:hypothetical protein
MLWCPITTLVFLLLIAKYGNVTSKKNKERGLYDYTSVRKGDVLEKRAAGVRFK